MAGRKPDVTDEELLREVKLAPGPVVTSTEMSDRVGMTSSGVNKRLNALVDDGYLKRREVGANAVVYWLTEKGNQAASDV